MMMMLMMTGFLYLEFFQSVSGIMSIFISPCMAAQ